jgi:ABC-type transport system involved in multi-copper enzyme maturation permease subunit
VTLLLLLDFSKTFDNVRHSLLLKKLSLYSKFGDTAVALVGSYLSIPSETIAVIRGGYLLFSIFINDFVPQIDFRRAASMNVFVV